MSLALVCGAILRLSLSNNTICLLYQLQDTLTNNGQRHPEFPSAHSTMTRYVSHRRTQ